MYECRVERDSITEYGERLTTFVVTLPRIVLAELNTHRMLSKSSASSRAIPVEKQIARLTEDPFLPVYWGKNQKGMQAEAELSEYEISTCKTIWLQAAEEAVTHANLLLERGVHKQITNRLLEPFMWHTVIISGTEWSNFFHLRDHKDAQPEIAKAARMMREAYYASTPRLLKSDEWHLPFTSEEDTGPIDAIVKVAVGRCARVSYLNHDGKRDPADDVKLAERVLASGHMAPYEHVARPMTSSERQLFSKRNWFAQPQGPGGFADVSWNNGQQQHFLGNFNGWVQARKMIHGEWDVKAFGK
jgi:thymidylate synthase ThyX